MGRRGLILGLGLSVGITATENSEIVKRLRITEQAVQSGSSSSSNNNRMLKGALPQEINTFQNFNLTFLRSDPDFIDFLRVQMPRPLLKSGSNSSNKKKPQPQPALRTGTMSKFLTVKLMIMFFQSSPQFGKYNHYGCWCFPDGTNDLGSYNSGYGEPVDEIDKTCKRMSQCYKCAQMRYGKSECPSNTTYNYQGLQDDATGLRYIKCLDPENTCARSLCECDRKMAAGIGNLEDEWHSAYHSKWGSFNREQTCSVSSLGFGNRWRHFGRSGGSARSFGGTGGGGGNGAPDACCGQEGEMFPYNTDGGRRGCCDGRTYSTEIMKCCPEDGVKSLDAKCL